MANPCCLIVPSFSVTHTHTHTHTHTLPPPPPLSQLQCPYLMQLLGARISHSDRVCALVCEKMSRACLYVVLHVDKPHMEWEQRLRIVRDICRGMAFIHSHNVLHRNLLPTNILVSHTHQLHHVVFHFQ